MIVLVIPILVIVIVVLTVRYLRINARVLSREEFHTEATERAKHLEHKDPVITCDYCGAKIDTSIYMTCPNCGGTYEEDEEWRRRHSPDFEWAKENSEEVSEEKVDEAWMRSEKTAKKLKFAIIALLSIFILLIGLAAIGYLARENRKFRSDESPNERDYQHFERQSYHVQGDNVILDQEGVKVTVTGFYAEESPFKSELFGEEYSPVKVEYHIENHSKTDVRISFQCTGVNGITTDFGLGSLFGYFKKGSSVTVYESIHRVRGGAVKELLFDRIHLSNDEDLSFTGLGLLRCETDANVEYASNSGVGTLKYDADGVQIFSSRLMDDNGGYQLKIFNNSGTDFELTGKESGVTERGEDHIYRASLPKGYMYFSGRLRSNFKEKRDSSFDLSITFTSATDPSKDFSTGYFSLEP